MNAFDACAQIRLDATPKKGKKCPGGYSIPAGKKCGGKKKLKGPVKTLAFHPGAALAGGVAGAGLGALAMGNAIISNEERQRKRRGQQKEALEGTVEAATGKKDSRETQDYAKEWKGKKAAVEKMSLNKK